MSVTEIKSWFAAGQDIIQHYQSYGLLDHNIDPTRVNSFQELITFLQTPFASTINHENLLYQIKQYKRVRKAIQANKEEKFKLFYKPDTTVSSNIATSSQFATNFAACLAGRKVHDLYQDDFTIYLEFYECANNVNRRDLSGGFDRKVFMFDNVQGLTINEVDAVAQDKTVATDLIDAFSNISGANFTSMLVDATAQFLVERSKKELSIAFFDKFREKMEEYPEVKAFFPAVYSLLEGLMEFQEPSVGKAWVEAFQADIVDLPKHFESFVLTSTDPIYVQLRASEEFQYTRLAYHVAEKIMEGTNGADLITYLNTFYPTLPNPNTTITEVLNLSYLLSKNIRYVKANPQDSTEQIWIHPTDLVQLNLRTKRYFLGLLYQEDKALVTSLFGLAAGTAISDTDALIQQYALKLNSFLVLCENIQQQHQRLQDFLKEEGRTQQDKFSAYLDYTEVAFQVVDYGFLTLGDSTQKAFYNHTLQPLMTDVLDILKGINEQNYAQVIAKSLKTIHQLVDKGLEESILTSTDSMDIQRVKQTQEMLDQLAYYGNFLVDIISADSTASMKKILNKYAAPIGSYKIKRNTTFSVDLQAFPGVYGGYEYLLQATTDSTRGGFVWGVTAPIGVSFNWGTRKNSGVTKGADLEEEDFWNPSKNTWQHTTGASNSIFISIVDIGAAFSYRWSSDNQTNGFPDSLKFTQILSPGIHYVHGFKNSPISLMLGAQYTPLLRSITQNGAVIDEFNAWRFGASIVVDIPIFNLSRRKR